MTVLELQVEDWAASGNSSDAVNNLHVHLIQALHKNEKVKFLV